MTIHRITSFVLLAACALGSGCAAGTDGRDERSAKKAPMAAPTTQPVRPVARDEQRTGPIVIRGEIPAQPVHEGPAPLVYMLPGGGSVRVVDKTSGQEILSDVVAGRTIIRIDNAKGVFLGGKALLPGPLSDGHLYAIYLTSKTPSSVRHSVQSPNSQKP